MRRFEIVLLATLFVLAGIEAWKARDRLIPWGIGVSPRAAVIPAKLPADVHVDNSKPDHARRVRVSNQASSTPEMVVTVSAAGSFPTRSSLRPGSTGAQITAAYGQPEARVTDLCGRHICERYYYYNKDHTQLTVATLENGILVSSNGTSP